MRSARSPSSSPSSALTRAAAPLMRPSQRTTETGTRSPEIGKLSTALVVSPPQSCSVVAIPRNLAAEGRQFPRHADRIVVGEQEPGAVEDAQLRAREEVERLLGRADRVQ